MKITTIVPTDKETAIKDLKALLNASGTKKRTIYCKVKHISRSGMYRLMDFYVSSKDGIQCINWYIEKLGTYKRKKNDYSIAVSGCGMDMGFAVVYDIGQTLYPNGDEKTITGRNGSKTPETSGGYLLKHEWI